jgi:hypothetical protein
VLENNIMRIATTAKLQAEQSDRARLSEARQASAHPHGRKNSRTQGGRADPGDQSVMSRRGDRGGRGPTP